MSLAQDARLEGPRVRGVWLAGPCHMMFVFGTGGVVFCVSHCVCGVFQGVYLAVSL